MTVLSVDKEMRLHGWGWWLRLMSGGRSNVPAMPGSERIMNSKGIRRSLVPALPAQAKNRNGPTGDVPLHFEAELMRFSTREADEHDQESE